MTASSRTNLQSDQAGRVWSKIEAADYLSIFDKTFEVTCIAIEARISRDYVLDPFTLQCSHSLNVYDS